MRLLVTGGRDYTDTKKIIDVLEQVDRDNCIDVMIVGDCQTGVDAIALKWAQDREVPYWVFEADWNVHGPAAGPIRNGQMITEGFATHCLAFPGGRGTADCVKQAREAGLIVRVVR